MSHRYPDQVSVRMPRGWLARLEALAVRDERTLAEFLRETFRKLLAAEARRERRQRTGR